MKTAVVASGVSAQRLEHLVLFGGGLNRGEIPKFPVVVCFARVGECVCETTKKTKARRNSHSPDR